MTWAMPNHVPAATSEPGRVRQRSVAAINDVNAGVPSRTAKTEAKDKYQFKSEQVTPIRMVSSQKISSAAPAKDLSGRETDFATSTAPTTPTVARSMVAARREFSANSELNRAFEEKDCGSIRSLP